MKGTNSAGSGQVDITSGDVYGVYYTYDANHRKIWHKGAAPVAAPCFYTISTFCTASSPHLHFYTAHQLFV